MIKLLKMKKFLIILTILIPFTVQAQKKGFKLVETNYPKGKPDWVTEYRSGFFKEQTMEAATLKDAEEIVYAELLSDIAKSVSANITVNIDHSVQEYIQEKGVTTTEYEETIRREANLKVSKLPELQGVMLSKGDIYYERYYNKKSKEEYYNYYLLYPFSKFELDELIEKYNQQEKAINERIGNDKAMADDFTSTEEIEDAIRDLDILVSEVGKEDSRISMISNVKNLLKSRFKDMTVEVIENVKEKVIFKLVYNGKTITSSLMPKLSSNCAERIECKKDESFFVVIFDDNYCYDESNFIKVQFNFKGTFLNKTIYIEN